MLGALQEATYKSGSVCLNRGEILLAYSDGLTECRNSLDEEFEMERLTATARTMAGATANQVLFSTLGAVLDFADTCSPGDDLTLLVVRRREAITPGRPSAGNNEISRPRRRQSSDVRPRQGASKAETRTAS